MSDVVEYPVTKEMAAKLRWVRKTAMDDLSKRNTEKRQRYIERIDILSEVIEWLEAQP